jgi:hypothetical protein
MLCFSRQLITALAAYPYIETAKGTQSFLEKWVSQFGLSTMAI